MEPVLLLVYNADSGFFASLADSAHKALRPDTYSCNLCAVTHGVLGMRGEWKEFLQSLPLPVEFLHRDEFHSTFESDEELPAVFLRRGDTLRAVVSACELGAVRDVAELKEIVRRRVVC